MSSSFTLSLFSKKEEAFPGLDDKLNKVIQDREEDARSGPEARKVINLQKRFPEKTEEEIEEALEKCGRHAGQAAALLQGTLVPVHTDPPQSPLAPPSPTNMNVAVDVMRARAERRRRAAKLETERKGLPPIPEPEPVQAPPSVIADPPKVPPPSEPESDDEFDWWWNHWDPIGNFQRKWSKFEDAAFLQCDRAIQRKAEFFKKVDDFVIRRRDQQRREAVERTLWTVAYDQGYHGVTKPPLPPWMTCCRRWRGLAVEWEACGLDGSLEGESFPPDDVMEVFERIKPRPWFLYAALTGEAGRCSVFCVRLLAAVLIMALYLGLGMLVFSVPQQLNFDGASGTLVDATGPQPAPVSTAAAVGLRALADYPLLDFQELRGLRDVVFSHNMATHALRVAAVARTAAGSVELSLAGGGSIRVEPDGRSFWQRVGFAETRIHQAEIWRDATRGFDADAAWVTAGVVDTLAIS